MFIDIYVKNGKHNSIHLQRSWDKHGENIFSFEILLLCSIKDLLFYEQKAIDVYRPNFNICPFAGNGFGKKWGEHCNQGRENIRRANTGRIPWNKDKTGIYSADYTATLQGNTYTFAKEGESVSITVTDVPQWVNENDQRQTAASLNTVTPTASGDVITYPDLLGTGAHLEIETQTARLAKRLTVPTLATLSTPTLSGTVQLALNFRMQRSNGVTIWVDGVQWNEASNNPKLTASNIEFKNASGVTLWVFRVPFATDSRGTRGNRVDGTMMSAKRART